MPSLGPSVIPCPCGADAVYDACCAPLHRGARTAATAEQLMRSRYAANVQGEWDYLFRTWHPRTRPAEIEPAPELTWTGLEVLDVVAGGEDDETGEVEFVAHWSTPRGSADLQERSRFERRAGRWVYVDGDIS